MPEAPDKDPVQGQSLASYLLIASLLLVICLGWALWDEFFGLRPWKAYQRRFVRHYTAFLNKQIPAQRKRETEIRESAEFQASSKNSKTWKLPRRPGSSRSKGR